MAELRDPSDAKEQARLRRREKQYEFLWGCVVAIACFALAFAVFRATTCNKVERSKYRPIDGRKVFGKGATREPFLRRKNMAKYLDFNFSPAGGNPSKLPSARAISNAVMKQTDPSATDSRLTALAIFFGQFIDHDLDLSESTNEECRKESGVPVFAGKRDKDRIFNIPVPKDDPTFDSPIPFNRSNICNIRGNPRQLNSITSFLDGSNIYGSDATTLAALTGRGGKLLTRKNNPRLLPLLSDIRKEYQQEVLPAGCDIDHADKCFVAGDTRVNEHLTLTAFHTLFMREHNYHAGQLKKLNPKWPDSKVFQQARRIVVAELQAITFNEFLPALLGNECPSLGKRNSRCCRSNRATISIEFSTMAYRFGHSGIPNQVNTKRSDGSSHSIHLDSMFFPQDRLVNEENLIPAMFVGLSEQPAMALDAMVVDGLRDNLFRGVEGETPLDLAAVNIQRGRDHGLRHYNQMRRAYQLTSKKTFASITAASDVAQKMETVYRGKMDNLDPFVGMLAEDPFKTSRLGELGTKIVCDQFTRLHNSDPFLFECFEDLAPLGRIRLADLIERHYGNDIPSGHLSGHVMTQGAHIVMGPNLFDKYKP